MAILDPATGAPLPDSAIQRILFSSQRVHFYQIPPLTSTRGFQAGPWTAPPNPTARLMATGRLRILETSIDSKIKCDIVLEDAQSGELFAAAPYTSNSVVQSATDSSRFFAVRVVGERGMKATLGIGFEDRGEAVDFGIALADERKVLGLEGDTAGSGPGPRGGAASKPKVEEVKRDWGLKDGESIVVNIGGKGKRVKDHADAGADNKALFSLAPPPGSNAAPAINQATPAAAPEHKADKKQAQELGFDDGEFGEFQ